MSMNYSVSFASLLSAELAKRSRTAFKVASGPPASRSKTLPFLSTTMTPRVVPLGAFLKPIASISDEFESQRSGYGKLCLVWKVVLAFGESPERP